MKGDEDNNEHQEENITNQSKDTEESNEKKDPQFLKDESISYNVKIKSSDEQINNEEQNELGQKTKKDLEELVTNAFSTINFDKKACCSILYLSFILFIWILFTGVFIYYNNDFKECKAELYTKIGKFLPINIGIILVRLITLLYNIFIYVPIKSLQFCKIIGTLFLMPLFLICFILEIINLVIIQKNYNRSISWDNCGNLKDWTFIWLIYNYIFIVINFVYRCCCSNK